MLTKSLTKSPAPQRDSQAAFEDIIRSKEAANREKDRVVLPALRRLLERAGDKRNDAPKT